jgi:hypothetical protein
MKLIFASPTYGQVDPQALKSQRIAIMHSSRNGHLWEGDASPDKMKFDVARNAVAREACESDADAVFWCDSDVILPADAITRLASAEKDFITGIYFQRKGEHYPLIARYTGTSFQWYGKWEKDVLMPIDGCGFGCVMTSVKMLRSIDHEWFSYEQYSEDFDFCRKADSKGYQLWADTGVLCGHLSDPAPVTFETFKDTHPELFGKNGNEKIADYADNYSNSWTTQRSDIDLSRNANGSVPVD